MNKLFSIVGIIFAFALGACGTFGTTRTVKEEFTVDLNSRQVQAGQIEAQFDRLLSIGGLKKDDIAVSYFPLEDAVCLEFRVDFSTYHQFWSRSGREAFVAALQKYNEDYAARRLNKSGRTAKRSYGTVEGYLIWQMYRYTVQARAKVDLEIGYDFKTRIPYFTVNQREAFFEDAATGERRETQEMALYFTRAQAESLVILFDQQFLQSLASGINTNRNPDRDDY